MPPDGQWALRKQRARGRSGEGQGSHEAAVPEDWTASEADLALEAAEHVIAVCSRTPGVDGQEGQEEEDLQEEAEDHPQSRKGAEPAQCRQAGDGAHEEGQGVRGGRDQNGHAPVPRGDDDVVLRSRGMGWRLRGVAQAEGGGDEGGAALCLKGVLCVGGGRGAGDPRVWDPKKWPKATCHSVNVIFSHSKKFWWRGWGCTIEAVCACRSAPPGARLCAPLEEGVLRLWMGGLGVHPLGWGCRGGGQVQEL